MIYRLEFESQDGDGYADWPAGTLDSAIAEFNKQYPNRKIVGAGGGDLMQCDGCDYIGPENLFDGNNHQCPKCGSIQYHPA